MEVEEVVDVVVLLTMTMVGVWLTIYLYTLLYMITMQRYISKLARAVS